MRRGFLFLGLVLASFVAAHVRLIYSANGNVLYWDDEQDVSVVINEKGSDDIPNGGHFTALREAITAWNKVGKTSARLVEDTRTSEQKSTNWQSDARHLLYFDENNSSGYFPGWSGIVAVTPLTFYTSGRIIDADVLFNGKNFAFTTEGAAGRYDVQDVATHELGHLLGLDHSACAGASMYPYVDPTVILHRSLSIDDIHGLQHMYPDANLATIEGKLTRQDDGSAVKGAWIGARDAKGRLAGADLTDEKGRFQLRSLQGGTYEVYATPLGQPVGASNLTDGHTIQTDFEARVLGTASAAEGATVHMGTRQVGSDVAVGLGRVADDYPLRVISGQPNVLTVRGSGLVAGSTLTPSDPDVALSNVVWNGSSVRFTATPPAGAPTGHVDLTVRTPAGDTHILCAGLEITPPDPTVSSVSPATGDPGGGTSLTITGTGFNPGARVVIGNRRYPDGWAGTKVVDSSTITLTTKATIAGTHDVVVIDPSGVEGRGHDDFTIPAHPGIDVVFPEAGAATGGTSLTITGQDFVAGTSVTIDGVVQANTTVESLDRITVVTGPGVVGGPYVLQVESPGGETASAAFVYTAKPDPVLSDVTPSSGSNEGGEMVTLTGANFTRESRVVFGANTRTGAGGLAAGSLALVDPNTIRVETPASPSTSKSVMVREADTGQATVLTGAYTFEGNVDHAEEDDGGGGCAAVAPARPPTWRRVIGGAGWALLLALVLAGRAHRSARAAALVRYAPWPAPSD